MSEVIERFLRYVKIDTQSQDGSESAPSTEKQSELARLLERELRDIGASDVKLDEHCYLTATIPAAGTSCNTVLGLVAHIDTSEAVSGANVKPVITSAYAGGNIIQSEGETLSAVEFPELLDYVGEDIISSDGTTLLGADDKAGVAEIMTLAAKLLAPDAQPHCKIRICFTPDEEVGRGVDFFDVEGFGADFAYTVDGGPLGELNCENFNAADADVTIKGSSIHPGSAKGRMVNAAKIACELDSMLPRFMDPACTEGREGFFHLTSIEAVVESARARYIIRDHDRELFEGKKALFAKACDYLNAKYGEGTVNLTLTDTYYNMKEKVDDRYVDYAAEAMRLAGVEPLLDPIRGGTDGSRLSYMGLPCPNLCTGGHNFHGRREFISAQSMEKVVEILEKLVGVVTAAE